MFPQYPASYLRQEYQARVDAALQARRYTDRTHYVPRVAIWLSTQLQRIAYRLRGMQPRRPVDHTA